MTEQCRGAACPFWESAADPTLQGCFVERRLGLDLLCRRDIAGWLVGLRGALERAHIEEGRLP